MMASWRPRRWLREHWRAASGALVGAGAGAAYAHFVGCSSGGCAITSNPWTAAAFGAVIGTTLLWPSR